MDISIVIPTYNRKDRLKQCLESVFKQDYPQDKFEVIVVDDGSTDGTPMMLKALSNVRSSLRYFIQAHKGPAAARNLGIKNASANIIGFTDNDCVLSLDWTKKMVEAHKLYPDAVVIGGLTKVDSHRTIALVSQSLSNGAIQSNIDGKLETIFFPTCNVSLKKSYLSDERFDESFPLPAGEDLELFWRLFKKGHNFIYDQGIEIFHDCHPNLKSFLKQAYMYGRGNYRVQHIHGDQPLLKEIKIKNNASFFIGSIINFIKIPRFARLQGRHLINSQGNYTFYEKAKIYFYFALHKIMYLIGNLAEHKIITQIKESIIKPEFIILDLTHRCNLKCNICEIRKDKDIKELTTNEIEDLILQSIDWGVKDFVLSGGEPFVREDIFEVLDFVKKKNYHVGVLTNGILLNESFIKKISPYLISNSLSLAISLDALTPGIHDDIRGNKGCFEKTFNGLKLLSEFKKQYPSINFNTISIILNENLEELLDLANSLKALNVNSIQFQPLLANNLIMKNRSIGVKYWIPQDRIAILDKVVDELVEFKRQNYQLVRNSENNLNLVKKYFRCRLANDDIKCLYGTKTMLIANTGDVTTCFDCYGNVKKKKLKGIYFSKESVQAKEMVASCKKPCLLPCFTDI